jgi:hypothetical protein
MLSPEEVSEAIINYLMKDPAFIFKNQEFEVTIVIKPEKDDIAFEYAQVEITPKKG